MYFLTVSMHTYIQLGFCGGSDSKESACNAGDLGLIPGSGRSPGEGAGNTLQYSSLGNPIDKEAWCATIVHGESDVTNAFTLDFPGGTSSKELPCQEPLEIRVQSLGWEDPLQEGMAPHSSTLPWRIPWTEEPGWLQSIGSRRVGHD